MSQYPNAGLFPRGRETLVSHIESGPGVAGGALQIGGGRGIAHKWLWRRCAGEPMRDGGCKATPAGAADAARDRGRGRPSSL